MEWIVPILTCLGLVGGVAVVQFTRARQCRRARGQASTLMTQARQAIDDQAEEDARRRQNDEALRRESSARRLEHDRQALGESAASLVEHEQTLDACDKDLARREQELHDRRAAVVARQREYDQLTAAIADAQEQHRAALEAVSQTSAQALASDLVEQQLLLARHHSQQAVRTAEEQAQENSPAQARRLIGSAIERYDGVGHLERVHNTMVIDDPGVFSALADPEGAGARVFNEVTGCELVCESNAATVRGDDPLAREIARRVLQQIAASSSLDLDRLRKMAADIRREIDTDVVAAGERAVKLLELGPLHPEILRLVGRLKYRLSYSQNQWKHSVEVAYLAGMMASELGVDARLSRRGGLLHDIGKAMTHDHEGGHAVLGAEVARRCGEDEIVANAVGSHHNDEPPRTAIAHIVTAADALSGARPGARRESVTQYMSRIDDIQRIASRSSLVRRVDVMQAGREVRIVIGSEDGSGPPIADEELYPLAQEIARAIEEEVTFAGQIRVTVIRESRAVAVAS